MLPHTLQIVTLDSLWSRVWTIFIVAFTLIRVGFLNFHIVSNIRVSHLHLSDILNGTKCLSDLYVYIYMCIYMAVSHLYL